MELHVLPLDARPARPIPARTRTAVRAAAGRSHRDSVFESSAAMWRAAFCRNGMWVRERSNYWDAYHDGPCAVHVHAIFCTTAIQEHVLYRAMGIAAKEQIVVNKTGG